MCTEGIGWVLKALALTEWALRAWVGTEGLRKILWAPKEWPLGEWALRDWAPEEWPPGVWALRDQAPRECVGSEGLSTRGRGVDTESRACQTQTDVLNRAQKGDVLWGRRGPTR